MLRTLIDIVDKKSIEDEVPLLGELWIQSQKWLLPATNKHFNVAHKLITLIAIQDLLYDGLPPESRHIRISECQYLSFRSVARMCEKPFVVYSESPVRNLNKTLLNISNEHIIWRSENIRNVIFATWLLRCLVSYDSNKFKVSTEMSDLLPAALAKSHIGKDYFCPILGAKPLSPEILSTVIMIAKHGSYDLSAIERSLENLVTLSRTSSWLSVYPWKYLGGNSLSLLARLAPDRLKNNYKFSRLAGLNMDNINCSQLSFFGCDLTKTSFKGTLLAPMPFEKCNMSIRKGKSNNDADFGPLHFPEAVDKLHQISFQLVREGNGSNFFAVSKLITHSDYIAFIHENADYTQVGYKKLREGNENPYDEYYLSNVESPSIQDPISYTTRDASIAYLEKFKFKTRLPNIKEWRKFRDIEVSPNGKFGEWIWDNRSTETANEELRLDKFSSESWLSLVANPKHHHLETTRVKPYNSNKDISFRALMDFPAIIEVLYDHH